MKKNLFLVSLILLFAGSEVFASPVLSNYRWRNDDGSETDATWKAAENDSIIVRNESSIRLRMEIYHWSGTNVNFDGLLYYASLNDTVFHLVTEDPVDAFYYATSTHVSNGTPTTEQLTKSDESNSTVPGVVRTRGGSFEVNINEEERQEFEFCMKPSPDLDFNQGFVFLLDDSDVADANSLFIIETLPHLYLEKPVLTVTAENASRAVGAVNPVVGVSYSGFVDGDDESVLDVLPSIAHEADASSAAGTYNIVPFGAEDNKYAFSYVNGSLTVTSSTALSSSQDEGIQVFPNPASDYLYLRGLPAGVQQVEIYNIVGNLCLELPIEQGTLNIGMLKSGMYYMQIAGQGISFVKE